MASGCGRRRVSGVCVGLVMAGSGVLAGPAGAAKDDVVLVSRASGADGAKANGLTTATALSADGRFAAFRSQASNLDPADTDTIWDMFVRDLQTGALTLVSRASGATGVKGNDLSLGVRDSRPTAASSPSAHGRRTSIPATPTGWTTCTSATCRRTPRRWSVVRRAPRAPRATAPRSGPVCRRDGRFVAFRSSASNLDPGDNDTTAGRVRARPPDEHDDAGQPRNRRRRRQGKQLFLGPRDLRRRAVRRLRLRSRRTSTQTTPTPRRTCSCAICRRAPRRW